MKKLFYIFSFLAILTMVSCSKPSEVKEKLPSLVTTVGAKLNNGKQELAAITTDPIKPRHGEPFKIVSYWKFNEKVPAGHALFFHIENKEEDEMFVADQPIAEKLFEYKGDEFVRIETTVKELPLWFSSDELYIKAGLYKGNDRLIPESKFNDGKNRITCPPIKTDAAKIVKKTIDVYVIAPESRKEIKIDGKLDESFWANAQTGGKFWRTSGRKIADSQTVLKVAMDDKYLYVGFECEDKDLYSPYKNNDDKLYEADVAEIFIDADGNNKNGYYELQVSPANLKFDKSFKGGPRRGGNTKWESNMKFAVSLDGTLNKSSDTDKGWTAEMAIPFDSIKDAANNPPKDGDIWKVYFYRIDKSSDGKGEYTGWIPPMKGDFHYLKFMGDMKFIYEYIK